MNMTYEINIYKYTTNYEHVRVLYINKYVYYYIINRVCRLIFAKIMCIYRVIHVTCTPEITFKLCV